MLMLKEVVFTSICFVFFSACTVTETPDANLPSPKIETQPPDSQPPQAINQSVDLAQSEPDDQASLEQAKKSLFPLTAGGSERVKRLQAQLKDSGFYSGAIDGITGAKTRAAIRRFKSSCTTLKDLIPDPQPQDGKGPASFPGGAPPKATADGVRVVQLRLKDAGFNPGPIDGIHGVKTEKALLALQSGCAILKNPLPDDGAAVAPTAGGSSGARSGMSARQSPPESLSEKPSRQAIIRLQLRLRDAGFNPGPIDGILGPQTKTAMQAYGLASH